VGVGLFCVGAYNGLDKVGWVPHTEVSFITAQPDWFVGEIKNCLSSLSAEAAVAVGKRNGYALSQLYCDGGPSHQEKIRFFGREEQT
jgi:hypothetical protein